MTASPQQPWALPLLDPYMYDLNDLVGLEDYQPIDMFAPVLNNDLLDDNATFLHPLSPEVSDSASSGSYPRSLDDDTQFALSLSPAAEFHSHMIIAQEPTTTTLSSKKPQQVQSRSVSPTDIPVSSSSGRGAKSSPRRSAHNRIEKRYRENLSKNFMALESTLRPYYERSSASSPKSCAPKQASRKMAILADAVNYIEELQEETAMLRKKMHSLRQTLLPHGIWKYTMRE
ncbi:hypothetical protein FE257_006606 [Aspergillus nanangensis]|uniref:BHLH domain-containing protein n=1 Tax=Aspergillus nanangensis TaxID=2582783 RepID=A0AAD4GZ89_ASPNN|nr:hypothetical protein FE257_006606 [Aspergillus nanangensis]